MSFKSQIRQSLSALKTAWLVSKYKFPHGYRRIYHYHVRKSAGTSLNTAFWRLAELDLQNIGRKSCVSQNGFIFVRHDPKLISQGNYFYASSHNPSYRLSLPPKTFTITILRDPLKRLLSYYRYLSYVRYSPVACDTEPYYKEVFKQTECMGNSFSEFLDNTPHRHLFNQLYMFSKTYDPREASEAVLKCNSICFTESFSDDLARLKQQLDLPLEQRRDRAFKTEISVEDSELSKAREILADEFKLIELVKASMASKSYYGF
jgi:hypothetical protein